MENKIAKLSKMILILILEKYLQGVSVLLICPLERSAKMSIG